MMRSFVSIALTTILVTLPGAVSAQIEIGFRGGINFATFAGRIITGGDIVENLETRTGFSYGGFVTLPVSSDFGIQIGAGYTSKGGKVLYPFRIDYIEIPVLASISLSRDTSNIALRFFAGPAISFRTSCFFRKRFVPVKLDCADSLIGDTVWNKKTDFGVKVGAGLDVSLAPSTSLLIEGMYDFGLSELGDSGGRDSTKNRVFSILAGLSFKLGD